MTVAYLPHIHDGWPAGSRLALAYAFLEGVGVVITTDPAFTDWYNPGNRGLPSNGMPAWNRGTTNDVQPSTQCQRKFLPRYTVESGYTHGARVIGSSALCLSYLEKTRLFCVCGVGSGATPTVLWESNDQGASWEQITTPFPDAGMDYNQVLGACNDAADNLWIALAHGANRSNVTVYYGTRTGTAAYSWNAGCLVVQTTSQDYGFGSANKPATVYCGGIACDPNTPNFALLAAAWTYDGDPANFSPGLVFSSENAVSGGGSATWTKRQQMSDTVANEQVMHVDCVGGVGAWLQSNAASWNYFWGFYNPGLGRYTETSSEPAYTDANVFASMGTMRRDRATGEWGAFSAFGWVDLGNEPFGRAYLLSTRRSQATEANNATPRFVFFETVGNDPDPTSGYIRLPANDAGRGHSTGANRTILLASDYYAPGKLLVLVNDTLDNGGTWDGSTFDLLAITQETMTVQDDQAVLVNTSIPGVARGYGVPIAVRTRYNNRRTTSYATGSNGLAAPTLLTPSNAATVTKNPLFSWTAVTGATRYRFEITDTSSGDPSTYITVVDVYVEETSARPFDALKFNTPYEWRIRADNDAGYGTFTSDWTFTTYDYLTGSAPSPQTPANGATGVGTSITVTWQTTTDDDSKWTVRVYADAGLTTLLGTIVLPVEPPVASGTTRSALIDGSTFLGGPQPATTYWWTVRPTHYLSPHLAGTVGSAPVDGTVSAAFHFTT